MSKIKQNERSWAIELINRICSFVDKYDLIIKHAGGEPTISQKGIHMFPDVLLFADKKRTVILQGWELKMPDVPITDEVFIHDAQRKALALGLDSCVIWNFTYAKFYVYNKDNDTFEVAREWELQQIKTREDVEIYQEDWTKILHEVILEVNQYLTTHTVRGTNVSSFITDKAINLIINHNKTIVSEFLESESSKNSVMEASIDRWWNDIKSEYLYDEVNKYMAYSKNILLNWSYRIIFAHLIKRYHQSALAIDEIDYTTTPEEANEIFNIITEKGDFFNVFKGAKWNTVIPEQTWNNLIDFSIFLKENGISEISQSILQRVLDGSINASRRELNGQFTTPEVLAEILCNITIHNWEEDVADLCCGTGTIPHVVITTKKNKFDPEKAIHTTWASDKYQVPLQIANVSMTSYDTINLAIQLFKRNVFELNTGDVISVIDPKNGRNIEVQIPKFGAICSNLPFVSFENIPEDDKNYTNKIISKYKLSTKSDLYCSIALYLETLLKDNGYLGIITSNSWLGTEAGELFLRALRDIYNVKQVHISGKGRWFQNAAVVTTIIILQKKKTPCNKTSFFLWKVSLEELSKNPEFKKTIINSSLLDDVSNEKVLKRTCYTYEQIDELHKLNLSLNSLFHNVNWVIGIKDKIVHLSKIFRVFRGCRRGQNDMFYLKDNSRIEDEFKLPALRYPTKVESIVNPTPDKTIFCCNKDLDELQRFYPNAYSWIKKFYSKKNKKGKPLPTVLKLNKKIHWYGLDTNSFAEFFTFLNPDTRIVFGKFDKPTFIDQRFIGLNLLSKETDKELCFALLNSILSKFFIEAVGFGRGLGVLDLNKNNFEKSYMLDPAMIDKDSKARIISAFSKVKYKKIKTIEQELKDPDWIYFNHVVLQSYNIDNLYDSIVNSVESLRETRWTANSNEV